MIRSDVSAIHFPLARSSQFFDRHMNELKQLGRYQLLRVLGRGAMGLVYEGVDPKLNRRVAIKVIQMSRIDDPALRAEYASRFIIEAQAVARLNHPNIVTVYDFGEESGVAYLVMELIAGEELGSYFDDSQVFSLDFTLEDSVRMTCELLDALDYAHQQGIIHRDIKPANVMLTGQLRVKLTDFGVARMQDVEANHTQAGTMVGTPSYMSPEQIMGQPVGPRADIFAAGIILYQFLTGERPFKGQGLFALQQQIVYGLVAPPSTLSPLISSAFDRVVLRALAKRPDDRYPSARAFRDDLQRALAGDGANPADTLPPPVRAQQAGMPYASSPGMPAWQAAQPSGAGWPAQPQAGNAQPPQHPGWPAPADMPSGLVMPSHPRPGLAPLPDDADPDATHVSGTSLAIPPLQALQPLPPPASVQPLQPLQPLQSQPPTQPMPAMQPMPPAQPAQPDAGGDADTTVVGATTPPGGTRR